ncbi:MAG: CCA tRNA nucleotidyltransferase [Treponema sp.]|nr:CCA tRNA nucleotidyltransferase [Treponema sp.]
MIRKTPQAIKEIASLFIRRNKQVFLVGGAVRDALRGEKNSDWDLATDAAPEEAAAIVREAGGKTFPTGIRHGTITAFYKQVKTEITTFRTEAGHSDGRRPDEVRFTATIEEDLLRRDFTMNACALRLPSGELVDPFGGARDIKAKIIRCVGDPARRFGEDGLRPLRAARFAAQLGFEIDRETLGAVAGALPVCAKVSKERVRDEIMKMLASPLPSRAFLLMEKTGLLELFLPELAVCREVEQKGFHRFDVLDHSLLACDYAARRGYSIELRLAALLHDIGKPVIRKIDESGVWTFYGHAEMGADIAKVVLSRLRFPNAVIDAVCALVKEHMFHYTPDWTDAAVRRFIARAGEDRLKDLWRLRRADAFGLAGSETEPESLLQLADRVEEVLAKGRAFSIKDLAVSGKDLMAIGVKPGKTMGALLRALLETVLDDPAQNTREKLLEIAGNSNLKYQIFTTNNTN